MHASDAKISGLLSSLELLLINQQTYLLGKLDSFIDNHKLWKH